MKEHYTRNTISVAAYCKKCAKPTQHRVDQGRKGPCLDCIARLEKNFAVKPKPVEVKQEKLFA
jgi:ribosomal protein L44E